MYKVCLIFADLVHLGQQLALPQKARPSEGRELTALCAEHAAWRARVRSGGVFRCVHLSRRTRPFSLHLSLSACLHLNLRLTWLIHRRSRRVTGAPPQTPPLRPAISTYMPARPPLAADAATANPLNHPRSSALYAAALLHRAVCQRQPACGPCEARRGVRGRSPL